MKTTLDEYESFVNLATVIWVENISKNISTCIILIKNGDMKLKDKYVIYNAGDILCT